MTDLTDEQKQDAEEEGYVRGSRMAWVMMLTACCRHLGVDDPAAAKAIWIAEREEAVSMLRNVCDEHGDNDWPDDLYLADIIEKHLWKHL